MKVFIKKLKSLCVEVESVISYAFDLSNILFYTLAIMFVEFVKSVITDKLKMINREAALV